MEGTEKENYIAVIALHKCGIACVFELLKHLNIMCAFVYRTIKLFLDTGGVSDHYKSGQPCVVCMPQAINDLTNLAWSVRHRLIKIWPASRDLYATGY